MSTPHPRGAVWRKWDLHVHAPGTKLNNGYATKGGQLDLEQFCQIVHESDVSTVAITDYFSLDGFFRVKEKYEQMYPSDGKLLLPNLELRLSVAVNRDGQNVNLHLIFPSTLTSGQADRFLGNLKTEGTTGAVRSRMTCKDLLSSQDVESASVSLDSIERAIAETFGEHAVHRSERLQHLLVLASAKGDGIRVGGKNGKQRKNLLSDEIDKYSDAFYANSGSRDYFLNSDRLESDEITTAKPVLDGCDAHSFDALKAGLGKHRSGNGTSQNITWIKADPTYVGLLQTLIEPAERVRIQATEPDQKEPYRVINKVKFSGTTDFPSEVLFNRNLNSVIGSRSSGKSALLAFISHAVDPAETVRIQTEAMGLADEAKAGPAAGFTWADVANVACEVEWESGPNTTGKVIYIPQNSLYMLGEQPGEITKKIAPALFRTYPDVKVAFDRVAGKISTANSIIRRLVEEWFGLDERIEARTQEIKNLGDKTAIITERDRLQGEIDRIKAATELTDEEVAQYQEVQKKLTGKETRVDEIAAEIDQLKAYVELLPSAPEASIVPHAVQVTITVRPSSTDIPERLAAQIDGLRAAAAAGLNSGIEKAILEFMSNLTRERQRLVDEVSTISVDNRALIAKYEANEELRDLVKNHKKQVANLQEIEKQEKLRDSLLIDQDKRATSILTEINSRDDALAGLAATFNSQRRVLEDLTFGIEADVPFDSVEHASLAFSQRSISDYVKHRGGGVDYEGAQADPAKFLIALRDNCVRLNKGYKSDVAAGDVLTVTGEIRFSAVLDNDRIGGFERSSMTPGKQALFALTLILNESQEPWPLLIDQPEDDLDSRSIYEVVVPYLIKRKKERQIIMVSHNANLVIGADSEQLIVANRHGVDRKNYNERTFDYLTGALEHSQTLNDLSNTTLGRFGIREHACEILDGGEEAFRKRREKYRVQMAR